MAQRLIPAKKENFSVPSRTGEQKGRCEATKPWGVTGAHMDGAGICTEVFVPGAQGSDRGLMGLEMGCLNTLDAYLSVK